MRPIPEKPGIGQESVWDYPRPPRIEPASRRIRVRLGGTVLVDTQRSIRVLETSHPPVYYVPIDTVEAGALEATSERSFCEWKGEARYFTVRAGERVERAAAWAYDAGPLAGHIAFYAGRMDACLVDDETVIPQPGGFYGGWITRDIVGPFKGGPGTSGW